MTVICIDDKWLHLSGPPAKAYPSFMQPLTVTRTAILSGVKAHEFKEFSRNCWFDAKAFAVISDPETISILKDLNLKDEKPDNNSRFNLPDSD